MAWGEVIASERVLDGFLRDMTDEQARAITAAWGTAWEQASRELEDALTALAEALGPNGRLTGTHIVNHRRALQAVEALEDALVEAARLTGVTISDDVRSAVALATRTEQAMIAAQVTGPSGALLVPVMAASSDEIARMIVRVQQQITARTWPLGRETGIVIRQELLRGATLGLGPREAARAMVRRAEGHVNFGLSRALTISRTELLDATRLAQAATEEANAEVLEGWTWFAHLDPATCRSCISMHGRVFPVEEEGPIDHPNGRCARIPKVKPWADLGIDLPDERPEVPRADEWFAGLSEEQQRAILGERGYAAWVAGEWGMDDWTVRREAPEWRDSMVAAPAP